MSRIQNVTNGYWYRPSQLARAFDECAVCWTDESKSAVRSLSIAEAVQARIEQKKTAQLLPYHELPGVVYRPAKRNEKQHFASMEQVWEAHEFAREIAAVGRMAQPVLAAVADRMDVAR
jgi:hypothetical protein